MSTTLSHSQGSTTLGESWVVSSVPSLPDTEQQNDGTETNNLDPRPQSETNKEDDSNTMDTSESLMSGPELIMPSICEEPILMSHVRSGQSSPSTSQTLKRKRTPKKKMGDREDTRTSSEPSVKENMRIPKSKADVRASGWTWERPLRAITNLLLIAAISHLLVVPEVVYHSRRLCTIPTIPALYPTSCSQLSQPRHYNHRPPPTRYDSVLSLQTQLEILFNSTLEEITPYANSLPETESILRDIQTAMKQVQSGPRHELTLEFDGCRQALTTATRKLDSLKVDLRSAVDSLMATGGLPQDSQTSHHHDVTKDVRLSTQMARREKYLDQLAARMRLKTDSLTGDFATVADHLESLKRIVEQQALLQKPSRDDGDGNGGHDKSNVYKNLRSFVDSIVPGWRVPR